MTAAVSPAPRTPLTTTPSRRPGSIRRTTNLDFALGAEGSIVVSARARDVTMARDGATSEVAAASLETVLDAQRRIVTLATEPAVEVDFGGRSVASGFRAIVDERLPRLRGTALGQLLLDVPVAGFLVGYARLRSQQAAGATPGAITPPSVLSYVRDVCSGWRSGGVMTTSVAAGTGVPIQDCPPAPDLAGDADAWHAMPSLRGGGMRRLRRIDLTRTGGGYEIDATFRDAYGEGPPSGEVILHEYALTGRLDADLEVTELVAEPRVLPFGECPWAAASLLQLEGVHASALRRMTRDVLAGTVGCTHLNDLVGCLADAPTLVASLAANT